MTPVRSKAKKYDYLRFWKIDISTINQITSVNIHTTIAELLNLNPIGDIVFEILQPFANMIIETNRNLIQHSRDKDGEGYGYFVLASKPSKDRPRITCTVGDSGVGFRNSLNRKGIHLRNDGEAIKHALFYRYNNREGAGLFRAVQLASILRGVVKMRSGRTSAFLNLRKVHLHKDDQVYN